MSPFVRALDLRHLFSLHEKIFPRRHPAPGIKDSSVTGRAGYHGVNRSSHVLSFARDGKQSRFFYGNDAQKTLEEIKGDAHRISRGVRFATEENDCLARENDRHASARTSPGTGATGTSERSPSGATLSKRLRNGRSNLLKPSLTRRL